MDNPRKRSILPVQDWEQFLEDGKKEFTERYDLKINPEYKKANFELVRTIGEGSFGRVYLSKLVKNGKYFAIKVLTKKKILDKKQARHCLVEKKILQALNFPFCIYLEASFQDNSYLYLCLPFVAGGELYKHLGQAKRFKENVSRFFGAQILLAFEYLHYCDMIFRDLKPENILIDEYGYLKLTDFGFCKVVPTRTYTVCGTPEYFAPEVLLNKGYGRSVDYWCFGVLLYEINSGRAPFHSKKLMSIYENISVGRYFMPKFFSANLADLIENILQVDVTRRFGCLRNGIGDIKEHQWFKPTNWLALLNHKVDSPYIPIINGAGDTSNFDRVKETKLTIADKNIYHKDFEDF